MKLEKRVSILTLLIVLLILFSSLPSEIGKFLNINEVREMESETRICSSQERQTHLENMCKATESERELKHVKPYSRFIYDKHNKIVYCEVAKAGCSAWKGIIIDNALNQKRDARTDVKGIHSRTIMDLSNISMVGSWKPEFDSYTKILFVRHPFDRVISAFYNLKHFKEGTGLHGPGSHIRHEVKRMFSLESLEQLEFTDFVRFITNKSLEDQFYYDRHFNSFAQTCHVCDVKYDKILRIESMSHDAFPILKDMGFSDEYIDSMQKSDNTRPGSIPGSTLYSNKVLNELKQLDTKYYCMLFDRYKFDFQMFGYGINMHSNVASCRIRMGNDECC